MKEIQCKEVIISTLTIRGQGVVGDPIRRITQIFTKEGELIAEHDPIEGQVIYDHNQSLLRTVEAMKMMLVKMQKFDMASQIREIETKLKSEIK